MALRAMRMNSSANHQPASSRIAVCSWSLHAANPSELLEQLMRLDISSVQLALSPLVHHPEAWGNTIDELRSGGVWIVSGMMAPAGEDYSSLESIALTGGFRPDHTWFNNRNHAEEVARLAARTGIGLVTTHAGFIPKDAANPERAKIIDRLKILAATFDNYGVELAFETGQETAESMIEALDQLDGARVGVNFDPANMILYGTGDPVDSLRKLAPRVRQVHIKDAQPTKTPGTWGRETVAGRGSVDWDALFEVAMEISPPLHFVIEREARNSKESDIAAARDLIAYHLVPQPNRGMRLEA